MIKNNATIKVETAENWKKAKSYIPDCFTIVVYTYDDTPPRIKIGDGKTLVNDLPFLIDKKEVDGNTLLL